MNDEQAQPESVDPGQGDPQSTSAEEAELRRQMEEEIKKVKMEDLVLQSSVSLLNLAARRIGKEDERDLAQARIGIDAAEALSAFVPEEARPQLAQAVSELKLVFAKESDDPGDSRGEAPDGEGEGPSEPQKQADSGLWTPGGEQS